MKADDFVFLECISFHLNVASVLKCDSMPILTSWDPSPRARA